MAPPSLHEAGAAMQRQHSIPEDQESRVRAAWVLESGVLRRRRASRQRGARVGSHTPYGSPSIVRHRSNEVAGARRACAQRDLVFDWSAGRSELVAGGEVARAYALRRCGWLLPTWSSHSGNIHAPLQGAAARVTGATVSLDDARARFDKSPVAGITDRGPPDRDRFIDSTHGGGTDARPDWVVLVAGRRLAQVRRSRGTRRADGAAHDR